MDSTWQPHLLRADELKVGDLVLGPNSGFVRIAFVEPKVDGLIGLWFTNPLLRGRMDPMVADSPGGGTGYDPAQQFFVLTRDVAQDVAQAWIGLSDN